MYLIGCILSDPVQTYFIHMETLLLSVWKRCKFRLCSSHFVCRQGGIFIVVYMLYYGVSCFVVLSEGPPTPLSRLVRKPRGKDSNPDPHHEDWTGYSAKSAMSSMYEYSILARVDIIGWKASRGYCLNSRLQHGFIAFSL